MSEFELKEWNPERVFYQESKKEIKKYKLSKNCLSPFSCFVIGKSKAGKSTFLENLYFKFLKNKFKLIVLISKRAFTTGPVDEFEYLPVDLKYRVWDDDVIQTILDRLDTFYEKKGFFLPVLFVLDDINDRVLKYSNVYENLYTMGRHYNLSVIHCAQTIKTMSTTIRDNVRLMVLYKIGGQSMELIEKILEYETDIDDINDKLRSKEYIKPGPFIHKLFKKVVMKNKFTSLIVEGEINNDDSGFYNKFFKYKIKV